MNTVPVTVTFEGVRVEETITRHVGCDRVVISGLPEGLLAQLPEQMLQTLLLNALASQPQAVPVERTTVNAGASAPVPAAPVVAPASPAQPESAQPVTSKVIVLEADGLTVPATTEEDAQHAAAPEPVPAPVSTEVPVPEPVPAPTSAPDPLAFVEIGGHRCRRCTECRVLFVPFSTLVHGGEGPGKMPPALKCPRHQPLAHIDGFRLQRAGFEFGFRPEWIDEQEVLVIARAKPGTTSMAKPSDSVVRSTALPAAKPSAAKQPPPVASFRAQSLWVRYTDDASEGSAYFKVRKCEHRERWPDGEGGPDREKRCGDWFQVDPKVDGDARCCPVHLPDEARDRVADRMMRHGWKYSREYVRLTEQNGKEHSLFLYRFTTVQNEEIAAYWAAEDARNKARRESRQALAELAGSGLSYRDQRIALFAINLREAYVCNGYNLPPSMPGFDGSIRLADPMGQKDVEAGMARAVVRGVLEGGISLEEGTNFPGFYSPKHAASHAALQARKRADAVQRAALEQRRREEQVKGSVAPAKVKPAPIRGLAGIASLNIAVAPAPASAPASAPAVSPVVSDQSAGSPSTMSVSAEEAAPIVSEGAQLVDQPVAEVSASTEALVVEQPKPLGEAAPQVESIAPSSVAMLETAASESLTEAPGETPVSTDAEAQASERPSESAVEPPPAETPVSESEEGSPPSVGLADLSVNGHPDTPLETVVLAAVEEQ